MDRLKLLIIEDDPLFGEAIWEALQAAGYRTRLATSGAEALAAVAEESFDLMLQDIRLPDANGLDILREILQRQPHSRALVMTGFATVDSAVEAMKIGAFDFLTKPFPMEMLLMKLQKVLEFKQMEKEIDSFRSKEEECHLIVSRSPAMKDLLEMARAVAVTDATVLLQGESGTGKELLAETIHKTSKRRHKPFIQVNCAAIPETLLESELFGVERGAFTGADRSRQGYLEAAESGTLLLDEIGDLPLHLQGKILRVLEEKKVFRVGGTRAYNANFRLIAATNWDLKEMVQEKKFREDLYFRLNVVPLTIPPLRERRDDIPLLIAHFQKCLSAKDAGKKVIFSPEALELLCRYDYPGNIRELKNIVEQLTVLYPGEAIKPLHIPVSLQKESWVGNLFENFVVGKPLKDAVGEFETRYIEKVLKSAGGNKSLSARILGISRQMLWEKLKQR
ncbi:sigma-54-dependent transcriptional regulator [Geotalea uraniireducens]|uniref:Two component, sigma-54 specific, transcriptional regulator, Fis family n=1 Tax=Geotalea uraniireducens (strain Rf4) TaxID=351605 RepID=A5G7L1_GEOUR|nr:sigma-54 dependent transcriptional regulator [Geotalea uraniireducens]ABQ27779.1 two component, sigma-54 specific, transcriptional regulator, Fis family [Geotalea uraniireducens Rf4]